MSVGFARVYWRSSNETHIVKTPMTIYSIGFYLLFVGYLNDTVSRYDYIQVVS
jgi:hypothetical protein